MNCEIHEPPPILYFVSYFLLLLWFLLPSMLYSEKGFIDEIETTVELSSSFVTLQMKKKRRDKQHETNWRPSSLRSPILSAGPSGINNWHHVDHTGLYYVTQHNNKSVETHSSRTFYKYISIHTNEYILWSKRKEKKRKRRKKKPKMRNEKKKGKTFCAIFLTTFLSLDKSGSTLSIVVYHSMPS